MLKADIDEAVTAMGTVIDALLLTIQGKTGIAGAAVRQACGQMNALGTSQLGAGGRTFWVNYAQCFEAAQQAGATYASMDAVRVAAEGLVVSGKPAIAVKNFSVRMALCELARILAATEFESRQDIDNYFERIDAAFDLAETVAADNLDNVAYRLLINIHAAVSNDLSTRSRPLPRMVTYTTPKRIPSLALAQLVYADPSRSGELIAENKPIHPLFMPQTGRALSS